MVKVCVYCAIENIQTLLLYCSMCITCIESILIKQVIVCLFVCLFVCWFVCLSVRLWTAKPQGLTG